MTSMNEAHADRIDRMTRFVQRMNEVERDLTSAYVRPRDAATLILVDRSGRVAKVLLGKRHLRHRFMPGSSCFPAAGSILRTSACRSRGRSILEPRPT